MLKAVVFDMDGVIVDTEWLYLEMEMKIAARINVPYTDEVQKKYCGRPMLVMWEDFVRDYALTISPEALTAEELAMLEEYSLHGTLRPIEGAVELVRSLASSGVACAIATSNMGKIAEIIVKRLGLKKEISFISSADKVKKPKPAPDIFLLAAKTLGVRPEDCVVIEDAKSGVAGAKAAGMKVVGFISPNSGEQDLSLADHITDDLGSLSFGFLDAILKKRYNVAP